MRAAYLIQLPGVVAIAASLLLAGCPSSIIYPDGPVPDGIRPDLGDHDGIKPDTVQQIIPTEQIPVTMSVDGKEATPDVFETVTPGTKMTFKATAACPTGATCNYAWDFGDGKAGPKTLDGGSFTFAAGYHHVRFTVTNIRGYVLGVSNAYIAAWTGTFSDDFNRSNMDWDKHGWVKPLMPEVEWLVKDNWLYLKHDVRAPGSTGLTAMPLLKSAHVEVTVQRYPHGTEIHYMDVLFRVHPQKRNTSFYRVRVDQDRANANDHLRIAVFKIYNEDEHGVLISDTLQSATKPGSACDPNRTTSACPWDDFKPCKINDDCTDYNSESTIQCHQDHCTPVYCMTNNNPPMNPAANGCAVLLNFDPQRKQDIRIIIDFRDEAGIPTWDIKIVDPKNPTTVFLEQKGVKDYTPNPHLYAGMIGLAHFDLETYFDDFTFTRTD